MIPPLIVSLARAIAFSILFCVTVSIASAREEHPMMHAASESLRAAQTSAHPIEDLEAALKRLRGANDNKAGYRAEAIRLTADAIDSIKAGKRIEANKSITQAITAIEKGIALHPNDNRRRKRK